MQILKPIEDIITANFVCGIENLLIDTDTLGHLTPDGKDDRTGEDISGFGMQTGFFYSEPFNPFVSYCIDGIYKAGQRPFVLSEGKYDELIIDGALIRALRDFGFVFRDVTQRLEPCIVIYDSSYFATKKTYNKMSYLIHWYDQSWKDKAGFKEYIKKWIKGHLYFFVLLYRKSCLLVKKKG